jgi:ABC-type branched-subunit amino acid transport system ATPase component
VLAQALKRSGAPRPRQRAEELRCLDIRVHFGGVKAVDGVDLALQRGEIVGLIGPNGAGKTTLVNAVTGYETPTSGQVFLDELGVTGWPPERLGKAGVARTFQAVRLFGNLTAFENVELGALGVGVPRREARRRAWTLLERMRLAAKAHRPAAALPYGDERRLGFLRALATSPSFLLLDEPAAGLNESESDELMTAIGEIRDEFECGVLVIEHDMRLIMRLCERIQVLDHGKTISIGTAAEVQRSPAVIEAYLGSKRHYDGAGGHGDARG